MRPGIRFCAWTGSHRWAAAIAAGLEKVPVLTIRKGLWDRVHGPPKTVRLSRTVIDEDRLRMLRNAGDEKAAELMEREIPKRRPRTKDKAPVLSWIPLGLHLDARVLVEKDGESVEIRHRKSGEIQALGREVLEKVLPLFPPKVRIA